MRKRKFLTSQWLRFSAFSCGPGFNLWLRELRSHKLCGQKDKMKKHFVFISTLVTYGHGYFFTYTEISSDIILLLLTQLNIFIMWFVHKVTQLWLSIVFEQYFHWMNNFSEPVKYVTPVSSCLYKFWWEVCCDD